MFFHWKYKKELYFCKEFENSKKLAKGCEFLELASMPEFQDYYVDCLTFGEEEED